MRSVGTGTKAWLLSSSLLLSCTVFVAHAEAAHHGRTVKAHAVTPHHSTVSHHSVASRHAHPLSSRVAFTSHARYSHAMHLVGRRYAMRYHGISCVPYAREVSGIEVAGNAWQWWDNAEGRYARGDRPEPGSVLNFRANGRMRLGHVAVVSRVVNPREIMVDHANWPGGGGGGISRDVAVVDVSEANDWSAVRVEMGRGGEFGSIYPTYGFIYDRPDTGRVTADISRPAPLVAAINRAPADLRPAAERSWHTVEEVAEAPDTSARRIDLTVPAAAIHVNK